MSLGRVIKGVGGIYTVLDLDTKEYVTLGLRGKLRYMVVDKNSTFNKQITHKTKLETKTIKISPKVGDYVVHENSGVGRYTGIEQITVNNIKKDYMKLEKFINVILNKFISSIQNKIMNE